LDDHTEKDCVTAGETADFFREDLAMATPTPLLLEATPEPEYWIGQDLLYPDENLRWFVMEGGKVIARCPNEACAEFVAQAVRARRKLATLREVARQKTVLNSLSRFISPN
jgi:hypothetical protein